jgi:hypothetical protein
VPNRAAFLRNVESLGTQIRQLIPNCSYQASMRSAGVKAASMCAADVPERETAMSETGSGVIRSR